MNNFNSKKSGFSAVAIISVIVAVIVIGALGYTAYNQYIVNDDIPEQSIVADDIDEITSEVPVEVKNTDDIDDAITALDQVTGAETTNDLEIISDQLEDL